MFLNHNYLANTIGSIQLSIYSGSTNQIKNNDLRASCSQSLVLQGNSPLTCSSYNLLFKP